MAVEQLIPFDMKATVVKEHDERVLRKVMEKPKTPPIVVSLEVLTEMLREERMLTEQFSV